MSSMDAPVPPAEKVKTFPEFPGVYLMKNEAGAVIYVGKAKNLRSRAGSYFLSTAKDDPRINYWIHEVKDIDYIQTKSEVDALLYESRLIKDLQPIHNKDLKDSRTFPYLQIHTFETFPRVEATRKPKSSGVKLYGPFVQSALRQTITELQKIFQFRTCKLDVQEDDAQRHRRPCLLASIGQCTAPCAGRISKEEYRKIIHRLQKFLESDRAEFLEDLHAEMLQASKELRYEDAARLRDEIAALQKLDLCGDVELDVQPEAFCVDPRKGVIGLQKVLKLPELPRIIEGIDIAHLQGDAMVASLVQFIDGLPFKPGYRRYKIKTVQGVNDFASIGEVVYRRFRALKEADERFPDILLIDGGKIQLRFALESLRKLNLKTMPTVISLAKRDEEVYVSEFEEPLRLSRHAWSLRLLQFVRDESHRFAQHYHHILRRKEIEGEE